MRTKRTLSEPERKAIYTMADEGLAYKDIAKIMQRPQGTINQVISKGILLGVVKRRVERTNTRKD